MKKFSGIKLFFFLCCINVYPCVHASTTLGNGFYAAANIGIADLMNKEFHVVNPESHQLGSAGIIGGGFFGFDYGFCAKLSAAVEIFAEASGLNMSIQHSTLTYSMHQRYELGVRVLPEYTLTTHTIGHLIFGYVNGKFNIRDEGVYGYVNSLFNKGGFQTGIGFTEFLTNHLSLRLDGLYKIYSKQTSLGAGLTTGTIQIYDNTFYAFSGELALIYTFS